jgi:hypothetical protein
LERGRYRSYHYIRQRPDGVIEETHVHSADALTEFARGMERLKDGLQSDTRPLREALRTLADRMPTSAGFAANATAFSHALAQAGAGAEAAQARVAASGSPLAYPHPIGKAAEDLPAKPYCEVPATEDEVEERWGRKTPGASEGTAS